MDILGVDMPAHHESDRDTVEPPTASEDFIIGDSDTENARQMVEQKSIVGAKRKSPQKNDDMFAKKTKSMPEEKPVPAEDSIVDSQIGNDYGIGVSVVSDRDDEDLEDVDEEDFVDKLVKDEKLQAPSATKKPVEKAKKPTAAVKPRKRSTLLLEPTEKICASKGKQNTKAKVDSTKLKSLTAAKSEKKEVADEASDSDYESDTEEAGDSKVAAKKQESPAAKVRARSAKTTVAEAKALGINGTKKSLPTKKTPVAKKSPGAKKVPATKKAQPAKKSTPVKKTPTTNKTPTKKDALARKDLGAEPEAPKAKTGKSAVVGPKKAIAKPVKSTGPTATAASKKRKSETAAKTKGAVGKENEIPSAARKRVAKQKAPANVKSKANAGTNAKTVDAKAKSAKKNTKTAKKAVVLDDEDNDSASSSSELDEDISDVEGADALPTPKREIIGYLSCSSRDGTATALLSHATSQLGSYRVVNCDAQNDSPITAYCIGAETRRGWGVLYAMACGVPLVSEDWLSKSISEGAWQDMDDYEDEKFGPSWKTHKMRQKVGEGLMSGLRVKVQGPDAAMMKKVLVAAGARVAETRLDVIINDTGTVQASAPNVTKSWLADSIEHFQVMDYRPYAVGKKTRNESNH